MQNAIDNYKFYSKKLKLQKCLLSCTLNAAYLLKNDFESGSSIIKRFSLQNIFNRLEFMIRDTKKRSVFL